MVFSKTQFSQNEVQNITAPKVYQEGNLQKVLKEKFSQVVNFKPKASRVDSSEKFVVCQGFKGLN